MADEQTDIAFMKGQLSVLITLIEANHRAVLEGQQRTDAAIAEVRRDVADLRGDVRRIEGELGQMSKRIDDQGALLGKRIDDQGALLGKRIDDQSALLGKRIDDLDARLPVSLGYIPPDRKTGT